MHAKTLGIGILVVALPVAAAIPKADCIVVEPAPFTIHIAEREGSGTFFLAVASGVEKLPEIDLTAATANGGYTIPRAALQVVMPEFSKSEGPHIVPITVRVKPNEELHANTSYAGKVIIFTIERQEVAFSVIRPSPVSFEVDPKTMSTSFNAGDDGTRTIRIRSTSSLHLQSVELSSLGFTSAEGQFAQYDEANAHVPLTRKTTTVPIHLPYPDYAGTYTGAIDVLVPSGDMRTVAVTFATRGPYGQYGLPLVLFLLVVIVGFAASEGLERLWSESRLQQLEVERILRAARSDLNHGIGLILRWKKAGAPMEKTEDALLVAVGDIDLALETMRDATDDQMKGWAAAASNRARAARAFRAELERMAPASAIAKAVNEVPIEAPNYRSDLRKAIAASGGDVGTSFAKIGSEKPERTVSNVSWQIARVRVMRCLLLLLVVTLFAYQTFYQTERDFGTSGDYIKVFLWALGLTQAGSQIITRIRSLPT